MSVTMSTENPFRISVVHPTARVSPPYPSFPNGWRDSFFAFLDKADTPQQCEYVLVVHESNWNAFFDATEMVATFGMGRYIRTVFIDSVEFWMDFTQPFRGFRHILIMKNSGANTVVSQANCGVGAASGDIIMGGMDDLFPPEHWDSRILDAFNFQEPEPRVLHVGTGSHMDNLLFIPQIFSRALFEKQGYVLHPQYESMFADNEFTEVARRDGIVIQAPGLIFEHKHPAFGTASVDSVYASENREQAYKNGLRTFEARKAAGFPPGNVDLQSVSGRKILALCLPGERFESSWVYHLVGLLGYLHNQFLVAPYFGFASDPYITRQGMLEGILADAETSGNIPDYVLWLDDDNLLSFENFARLLRNLETFKLDVIAGWCHIQGDTENTKKPLISCGYWPQDSPHVYHLKQEHIDEASASNQLIQVDWTGFPCVLMRFDVLKRAGERPFLNIMNPAFKWGKAGEDISFSRNIKERAGIQIHIDPCVKVPHMKLGDAGKNFYGAKPGASEAKGIFRRTVERLKALIPA